MSDDLVGDEEGDKTLFPVVVFIIFLLNDPLDGRYTNDPSFCWACIVPHIIPTTSEQAQISDQRNASIALTVCKRNWTKAQFSLPLNTALANHGGDDEDISPSTVIMLEKIWLAILQNVVIELVDDELEWRECIGQKNLSKYHSALWPRRRVSWHLFHHWICKLQIHVNHEKNAFLPET